MKALAKWTRPSYRSMLFSSRVTTRRKLWSHVRSTAHRRRSRRHRRPPAEFCVQGARVSYQTGSSRGAVTFTVVDRDGSPVPGVAVASESFSGRTQDAITDAAGTAVIWAGETEVLAGRLGGTEVRFRPRQLFFSPDCVGGLEVHVVLDS
jgi:hypothetical protein